MANVWFIKRDEQRYGPYSSAQLVEMAKKGQVLPLDWVAQGENGRWIPASQVKGLFAPPAAEQPVAPAAPAEASGGAFDFDPSDSAPKPSTPKRAGGTAGPTLAEQLKSLVGGLSRKAKIAITGGLLLMFVGGGSCVMFGGKSGTTTAGKNGSSGGSRGSLSATARENSEYKRGYKIGSDLGKRSVNGRQLDDPRIRPSAMKEFNKKKREFEKEYQDLLRNNGPDNDATLLYRGMLDGYTEELAKAGIDLN